MKDNPKNSLCIDGNRFIPIQMIDVAGLVPDAWKGRGLGNRFLDELRKASVLIHVVDASGGTDEEGRIVPPGTHDPCRDVEFLEKEIVMWIKQILIADWQRIIKRRESSMEEILTEKLSGLQISKRDIEKTLEKTDLKSKKLELWNDEDITRFCYEIRRENKPIVIAANKIDVPMAEDGFKKLKEKYGGKSIIIPCSAEAELVLRKAAEKGFIRYLPGDEKFEIINESKLTSKQRKALKIIEEKVLMKWKSTGVQEIINTAIFHVLKMIVVYPVEDVNKLSDHHGNVLPDALLIRESSTARELAYMIHQELGDTFLYAIDARTKHKIGEDAPLKMNDVIKIVATKARK